MNEESEVHDCQSPSYHSQLITMKRKENANYLLGETKSEYTKRQNRLRQQTRRDIIKNHEERREDSSSQLTVPSAPSAAAIALDEIPLIISPENDSENHIDADASVNDNDVII